MVKHDILHRTFYSTRRGTFGLFRAVDKSRDANELGAYLVAIENLVADDVLQGEDIVGQIVNAVSLNDKTYLLFEIQLQALTETDTQALSLGLAPSATITLLPLNYSLDKPE